ncbi:MAG TPA: SRPBCC family protein [Kineosporiaceae bacterium]|nr:SRPBCC family protein [Kineosporiaceae bacterium]
MTHQEATAVVNLPVADVETRLRDVGSWPRFVVGLEDVVKTAHERYTFSVRDGHSTREVPVCAIPHPREHRVSWKALSGPAFDGEFRLHPENDRQTRVTVSMVAEPAGFLANLSELFRSSTTTAEIVLQRLDAFLVAPVEAG